MSCCGPCGENISLGIRREYMILNAINGALSEVFSSGNIAPPLLVSLPDGEILLGEDNIGLFVDQNGKLLQEGSICWSQAPPAVTIWNPYALGLLPRHFENIQLTASVDFEEALALCRLLPPEDSSLRASKEQSIHISLIQ